MTYTIDNCSVEVVGGEMHEAEMAAYVARGLEKYGARLDGIDIEVDGEYVNLTYLLENVPFQRIRRITGYLVGTLDRINNAKRAEESQRVKHGM